MKTLRVIFWSFFSVFCYHNTPAALYYVAPGGNDISGNGTIGNPFKTLSKACQYVQAGDTILMRGGVYTGSQQLINASNNGTAAAPIVIKNYPGEEPIIDGTGLNLTLTTSLLMIARWQTAHMEHFVVEGITVRNSSGRGIGFYRTSYLTIRNCKVYNTQERGIGGFGYYTIIEGNEVHSCGLQNINGQMGNQGWPIMIRLTFDYENGNRSQYATIRNNYIHDCWGEAISPGAKTDNVLIENNIIRDVWSAGIYCDNTTGITIRNNYIYSINPTYYRDGYPANGILLANEEPVTGDMPYVNNITIYNNLLARCKKGVGFWFDESNTSTGNTYANVKVFYNNIIEPAQRSIGFDDIPTGNIQPSGCFFQNNIVEDGQYSSMVGDVAAWTFSHNCWVHGKPSFDQSISSITGNPFFTNPSIGGGFEAFRLTSWSPCLDAGTPVSGISTDYQGKTRDASHPAIGLHEPTFSVYYVDGSVSSSGNGKSWATAKKTLQEATNLTLNPGDIVYIRPGTYAEAISIKSNGAQIVGITANVSVFGNTIRFPVGTDLSGIDLDNHPEEYYAYVYRSWKSNNGYFKIKEVNDQKDYVVVEQADFLPENGAPGDFNLLSAAIGRPVVYRKYSNDPENQRVLLDCSSVPSAWTILYVGKYINSQTTDPADFNILDGIDVANSENGIHLNSSSFNVLANGKSYNSTAAPGILLHGKINRTARYNFVINYRIYDTYGEGIYVGKGGGTQDENHTHYNHLIGNEIYRTSPTAALENAIDIKEYNIGNVAESNIIRSFKLATGGNGAVDIRNDAHHTLVYNNIIKNVIGTGTSGTKYLLNLYHNTQNVWIFNNLIYLTAAESDGVYAVNIRGDNTSGNYFVHNTIYNTNRGLLVQNYGTGVGVTIANNIFNGIVNNLLVEWTNQSNQQGLFTITNNLFNANPNNSTYPVPSGFIGNAGFANIAAENFRLTTSSTTALDKASLLPKYPDDFDLNPRNVGVADLGAYEFGAAYHSWLGNSVNWNQTSNWSQGEVPGTLVNVRIPAGKDYYPLISNSASSPAVTNNLLIESGAQVKVAASGCLTVTGSLFNGANQDGIVLQSSATGTGSLIHQSMDVAATAERYVSGGWSSWDAGWHLISSPVSNQAIADFTTTGTGNGYDFYGWNEATNTWMNYKESTFTAWNGSNQFVTGRGYLVSYEQTQSGLAFRGAMNVQDIVWQNLSLHSDQGKGWHLLGNPFASALRWNDGNWNLNHIAGIAKIWSESGKSYVDILPDGFIPSAQGFFVQAGNSTNSLTIPAASRVHSTTGWYKNKEEQKMILMAAPVDGNGFQEMVIMFHPEATEGYDFYWDSRFLPGYAPQFYSLAGDEKLSTSTFPEPQEYTVVPLGFVPTQSGDYVIRLKENYTALYPRLVDLKTQSYHDFDKNPEYCFQSTITDSPERFLLVFHPLHVNQTAAGSHLLIYNTGESIYLHSAHSVMAEVSLVNMPGIELYRERLWLDGVREIHLALPTGWYVIRVDTGDQIHSRKVFLSRR